MIEHFEDVDGQVWRDLTGPAHDDVVVRLDPSGFIVHASANADLLGMDLSSLLLMPHIADLAEPEYVAPLAGFALAALAGSAQDRWFEFPLAQSIDNPDEALPAACRRRWFAFGLRLIEGGAGAGRNGLGVLRSIEHKTALAPELAKQAATDPLTGLANRTAFCRALARTLQAQIDAKNVSNYARAPFGNFHHDRNGRQSSDAMAVFTIDRMPAIFMQYGQSTRDEIRWGFSRFLESMTHDGQELAQLDEERFAVLLPGMTMRAARDWANDVLVTFSGLTADSAALTQELTASAGLTRVEMSVDWTLRQAELGLVMAKAGGGMRAGVCSPARRMTNGAAVERAMDAAVARACQRSGV
ncbi:MAG: GGDEF domain-containing protein [Pseudomonadota bacterium]